MTSAQVLETSVNVISRGPCQDYSHPGHRTSLLKSSTFLIKMHVEDCLFCCDSRSYKYHLDCLLCNRTNKASFILYTQLNCFLSLKLCCSLPDWKTFRMDLVRSSRNSKTPSSACKTWCPIRTLMRSHSKLLNPILRFCNMNWLHHS